MRTFRSGRFDKRSCCSSSDGSIDGGGGVGDSSGSSVPGGCEGEE